MYISVAHWQRNGKTKGKCMDKSIKHRLFGPLLQGALESLGARDDRGRIACLMKSMLDAAGEERIDRNELITKVLQPELGNWMRECLHGVESTPSKKCSAKREWEKLPLRERGELAMQYLSYFFLVVMAGEGKLSVTSKQFEEFDRAARSCISDEESIATGAANLAFGLACDHLDPETRALVFD